MFFVIACSSDGPADSNNNSNNNSEVIVPSNLTLDISIVGQNDSNPNGDGSGSIICVASATDAVNYEFRFGGGDTQQSTDGQTEYFYSAEGTNSYTVYVYAYSSTGHYTSTPENLVVDILTSSGSYNILVSASADYATSFEVLFGDEAGGDATPMQIGEQLSHSYELAGTYNVTITALSGGAATTQYSEEITITDPPVFDGFSTFEDFEGEVPGNFSFGGVGNVQVVANPDNSGINTSTSVMQCTKDQGAEVWGGMGFAVNGHINFNGNNVLRLKSYAPEVGKVVKVKLETSAGNVAGLTYEFDMVTNVANQWEILTYDFSGAPDLDYITAIVFYDFGNQDAGVYHFDDVEVGIGEYIQGIENFEGDVPESFTFGGVGGVEVIPNPDPSGENITGNVLQFVKDQGAEVWGGMGFAVDVIDFNGASQIHLKSYAPEAGKVVKVKLETSAGNVAGLTHEVDVTTTVANEWETLIYDFTGAPDLEYVSFIVFYDFGNTVGATYRVDEIQLID